MLNEHIYEIIQKEQGRQENSVELIASENFPSKEVRELCGSLFINKYAEGRIGKRYYRGCENIDELENIAENMACTIFNAKHANVQPHSGAQANLAVFAGLLKLGDKILSLSLDHGGHLSHGSKANISGQWFEVKHYGVKKDGRIDYDALEEIAREFKPKMIISGASAYAFQIDWERIDKIAKEVGAYHLADFSHYSGLIAGKVYDNPMKFCDVATTTTHKTLRGPRGGMILTNDSEIFKKINRGVFPGTQGGPHMNIIAAKAQCFWEAHFMEFGEYAKDVVQNAKYMAKAFVDGGFPVVGGGTESHMFTVDLSRLGISGKDASILLEKCSYIVNANTIPNDPLPPTECSGIRIGTAAMTTKGWTIPDAIEGAEFIMAALKGEL